IIVRGRPVAIRTTADALHLGMALVPEDRRSQGLVLDHTVRDNLLLTIWQRFTRGGLIDDRQADRAGETMIHDLSVKTSGLDQTIKFLSGGNQQKVVVGKALASGPSILLLDEPTFGVDIRSKQDIMGKVREFADAGNAALFVDSELEQMAAICDRVLVLDRGRIADVLGDSGGEIGAPALQAAIQGASAGTTECGEGATQ
ncbi:MAG: sugar ABC transporter ATP-binding protein, partial [Thermomicrobiales bacterium]|nr:sugar ABC transporter ATP-binding protein [Thermomicrobiales bacterium]